MFLFSHSVVSNSLPPHKLQHTRLPSPLLSPGVCTNSCPLSWWCHPIISSSVVPFSSCLQSFPESGSFPMTWVFGAKYQVAKVLELQLQHQSFNEFSRSISFRIDCFGLLAVQGTLKSLPQHYNSKALILQHLAFFMVQLSHPYMTRWKTIALIMRIFVSKVMSLLFNMPDCVCLRFSSKEQVSNFMALSPSAVILEPKKIKSVIVSIVSPSIFHEVMGLDAMICIFWMLSFKQTFSDKTETQIIKYEIKWSRD